MGFKKLALLMTAILMFAVTIPALAEDDDAAFNEIIGADTEAPVVEDMLMDVAYIDDDSVDHKLDLFGTQAATEPMPTIIEVHGGGFIGGDKDINTEHAQFYAQNGYLVVAPNYTRLPSGDFKDAIQDLFAAYNWVADHAEEYNFDLSRVAISGDSAGGYYVLITAAIMVSPELQEYFEVTPPPYDLQAYVTTCPATDILAIRDNLGKSGPAGYTANKIGEEILNNDELMSHLDLYSVIDPETYPFVYMITTPGDVTTGAETLKFDAFLTEQGIDHILMNYEDEGSGLIHVFNILKMAYPESQKANADIVAYLDGILN